MKIIQFIGKHQKRQTVIILLTFTIIGAILIFSQSFGATPLADEKALDPLYYYNSSKFYEVLHSLSISERTAYKLIHLADYFFMFGFYSLISIGLSTVLQRDVRYRFIIILPLFSLIFDFIENLIMDLHLYFYPNEIHFLGEISGYFTALKFGTLFLSVLLFIVFLFLWIYKKLKNN